jgi:hypothetical protein
LTKPYWAIAELTLKMLASSALDAIAYALVIAALAFEANGGAITAKSCATSFGSAIGRSD